MILKFIDKLPETIYLDASVILNASMKSGRFHKACSSFMRRIRNEGVSCATATLTFDEIWYVLIKNNVEKLTGQALFKSHKLNPDSILSARDDVERITFDMLAMDIEILNIDMAVMLEAKDFMWEYRLLPRDSIHLAVSTRHRIKAIATTNKDFTNAAGMVDIYTTI